MSPIAEFPSGKRIVTKGDIGVIREIDALSGAEQVGVGISAVGGEYDIDGRNQLIEHTGEPVKFYSDDHGKVNNYNASVRKLDGLPLGDVSKAYAKLIFHHSGRRVQTKY